MSHAYTILGAFTITESSTTWNLLLARNPWGSTYYSGDWKHNDSRWTTANKARVPYNLGDDVVANTNGLFVIPIEKLINNICFDGIDIALSDSGYSNSRYDYENAPVTCYDIYDYGCMHAFEFTLGVIDGPIFITA